MSITSRKKRSASLTRRGWLRAVAPICALLVLPLPFVPQLAAQKIKIEYEKTTDFSKLKTYAWVPGTPVFDPQMDAYIQNRFVEALRRSGMIEAAVNAADVLVTYHAALSTDLNVGTALDPTFAASGGTPIAGHSIWETTATGGTHVTKGSIAFEILDRVAKRPVWIGTAKHTVSDQHHERWNDVEKALDKLLRHFPPKPAYLSRWDLSPMVVC
jgi:Domain of unknown function (DUF4136)